MEENTGNDLKWYEKFNNWLEDIGLKEVFYWVLIAAGLFLFNCLLTLYKQEEQNEKEKLDFWQTFFKMLPFHTAIDILSLLIKYLFDFKKKTIKALEQVVEKVNVKLNGVVDQVDGYLNKAKIVFETSIKDYDDDHLLALKKILNSLESKNVKAIYAIDHSVPIQWWSETMTGYMALLSNWKAKDKERHIHRIFVFTKNELHSPIVTKTLTLHSLMGFKTYVFSKEKFERIFSQHSASLLGKSKIQKKEILIWEEPLVNLADCVVEANNRWANITCYQSFWDMSLTKEIRAEYINNQDHEWFSYDHNARIKSRDIKIWFEFIPISSLQKKKDNWIDMPKQYLSLIELLISKSVCCNDVNDINGHTGQFGIEIKTEQAIPNNSHPFEFTTNKAIKEILRNYASL